MKVSRLYFRLGVLVKFDYCTDAFPQAASLRFYWTGLGEDHFPHLHRYQIVAFDNIS